MGQTDTERHAAACEAFARVVALTPAFDKILKPFYDGGNRGVVIAGGAIRDAFHDVPIKDIDVFIPKIEVDPQTALAALKEAFGPDGHLDFVSYGDDSEVLFTFTFPTLSFAPVNFIVVADKVPLTGDRCRMDFGLCQAWYDGIQIECTEAFQDDYWNQTFTLKRCASLVDFQRSMRRWSRLAKKYPGHTLVIPPEFQPYESLLATAA